MDVREELQELRNLRKKILTAIDDATETATVENYNFNDSNGGQSVKRRSPKELLGLLNDVDRKITTLERQLQGCVLRTFGMNRYG